MHFKDKRSFTIHAHKVFNIKELDFKDRKKSEELPEMFLRDLVRTFANYGYIVDKFMCFADEQVECEQKDILVSYLTNDDQKSK